MPELPIQPDPQVSEVSCVGSPSEVPVSIPTIGIVEDDAGFNRALDRLLRASGFQTETFRSGEDFLASAGSRSYECLILDIHLPGISGFELFDQLSASGSCPPVIFITAEEDETVRAEAYRISGNLCMRKPLAGAVLLAAVHAQLRQNGSA